MQRPNRPMSGFEKFQLSNPSPSTINDWISYRPKFVLRKIYGYTDFPTSCPMERGTQSEYGVKLVLQDGKSMDEAIEIALSRFDEKCHNELKDYDAERATIPHLIRGAVKEIQNNYGKVLAFQTEVTGKLGEYTYRGFTDFILETEDKKKIIVDLKTAKRTPFKLNSSHARQISLYANALECDAVLLYLIPHKKTDRKTKLVEYSTEGIWWEIKPEDKKKYLDECLEVLRIMDTVLYNCNDKKDVADLCYPNVDDFYWSDSKIIEARKKVWGI